MAKKKQILDETSSDTNKTQKRQYVRTKVTCPSIDAFIHDVQRVAAELGKKTVTCTEYEDKGKYSRSYIVRYIPSWAEVLQKAELEKSGYKTDGYTDEELLNKLSALQDELNHKPTCKNVRESQNMPSLNVYYRHFDNWNDVLSRLEEYKLKLYKDKHKDESADQMPMQIIGLQILPETDERIRKSLEPGWYPFVKCKNNIGVTEDWPIVDDTALPKNFFHIDDVSVNGSDVPEINVMAIVGKNGTGKSSLINIMYMLINNLAYVIFKAKQDRSIGFVRNLHAKLYYRECNSYFCVSCLGNVENTKVFINKNERSISNPDDLYGKFSFLAQNFFYTISINYSQYAHNPEEEVPITELRVNDYMKASNWINYLFNKNDGYQIPIVLAPYRDLGQIDVHKESRLATRRIINLSLLFHIQKDKEFIEGYIPARLLYSFDESYENDKRKELVKTSRHHIGEGAVNTCVTALASAWKKFLAQNHISLQNIPQKIANAAIFYLAYKTFKIFVHHKVATSIRYKDLLKDNSNYPKKEIVDFIQSLYDRPKDHITRKLHQCICFLQAGTYDLRDGIDVDKLNIKQGYTYDEIDELLPPPFYMLDLNYKHVGKNGEDLISLRLFSSGEKQILYSTSYVLYHMNNLAGIFEDNNIQRLSRIKYRRLLLIFDEAELYYHPDFQREFVYKLLRCIQLGRLNQKALNIKAINILIVTHSPYMLSDIPACNILRLGELKKKNTETFGANIYDLLNDQFFMDSFVGEFAKQKIETMINRISKAKKEEEKELKTEISLIGDEWVQKTLLAQLDKHLKK